jgi:hypothetical protein
MKSLRVAVSVLALVAATGISLTIGNVAAQSTRPYAGLQTRSIKALSAEQIADLKAGRGMSLALAAELNGYPGPRHVLELGEQLSLTDRQRMDVQRLFDQMTAEVVPIGEKLIAQEAELDRVFARRLVTPRLGHRRHRGYPGRTSQGSPEISFDDVGAAHTRADAALCPIARLCRGEFRQRAQAEPLTDGQETHAYPL